MADGMLHPIDDTNIELINEAGNAVLILAKSDCEACHAYEDEVAELLEEGELPSVDIVGKLVLDEPGSAQFKRDNPWVQEITFLPYTVLYQRGEPVHRFATSIGDLLKEQVMQRLAGVGKV